ncbi:MAG: hypothetical protein FVQ77_16150 [Cytophagales bacterium]|nr:hypothetical protein [Cytophagales bacterium]
MPQPLVHSFHIPVMGIGFSLDSAIKIAHFGISSVISLVDDILMEKMREYYCKKINRNFTAISKNENDFRVKRITAYLNLVDGIVKENFERLKNSLFEKGSEIIKYLEMLPDTSPLKHVYNKMLQTKNSDAIKRVQDSIRANLSVGSVDVNIMAKLDKVNYKNKNEELSAEYNDAYAALRGYALSDLNSSIIFSAGMNPGLYSYIENFEDFFPDNDGVLKKKIIIKVSDYRSAIIQGKFLAKKGLWVSEYRIESGLNCGGHTFATNGYLLGPVLEEFKNKREELIHTTNELLVSALKNKNKPYPETPLSVKITAQGGIGNASEHNFLLQHFKVDSTGWGTPFLLVPEVTNVDSTTLNLLCNAKEEDLYLSNISPLGVPFNSIKGNTKDIEKQELIDKKKPGSSCPKKFIVSNKEFTTHSICTASRQYQNLKIKELESKNLNKDEFKKSFNKIIEKSCICVGLGTSALLVNKLDTKVERKGVSICPGPNMAYFSKVVSLKEMTDHIYGRIKILNDNYRPNMFIKELKIYVDYLKNEIKEAIKPLTDKQVKHFSLFKDNLLEGIEYYRKLFSGVVKESQDIKNKIASELEELEKKIRILVC